MFPQCPWRMPTPKFCKMEDKEKKRISFDEGITTEHAENGR